MLNIEGNKYGINLNNVMNPWNEIYVTEEDIIRIYEHRVERGKR